VQFQTEEIGVSRRRLRAGTWVAVLTASLAGATSGLAASGHGASQAAPCSDTGLQKALDRGGTYEYRAACTLKLTQTLTQLKGTVTLDGNGHTVVFEGAGERVTSPAFQIEAGSFTLSNIEVRHVVVLGAPGTSGTNGTAGSSGLGATVANGGPGAAGGNAGNGAAADGSALSAAAKTTVTLDHDTFASDVADGGNAGNGGGGGDGGSASQGGGNGGAGGNGGKGGTGGNALGGAVYSAGTLRVVGGLFKDDAVAGGFGGQGGVGGDGGQGGAIATTSNFTAGAGGAGGASGAGGAGYGGALYASGSLTIKGTSFVGDQAFGGTPGGPDGLGGDGGSIPSGQLGNGGVGGNGGGGANGGKAVGGAIDDLVKATLAGLGFKNDKVTGGPSATECPGSSYGCGSISGNGGSGSAAGGAHPLAAKGRNGVNGKSGHATDPDFPSFNRNSGLPLMKVGTKSIPAGVSGRSYDTTLAAKGGIPPYTWSITKLPAGLKATKAGVIHGTPELSGTFEISIKVTDLTAAKQTTGKATLKLVVR
jgi:hypothetical protein